MFDMRTDVQAPCQIAYDSLTMKPMIDKLNDMPVYRQLYHSIKNDIACGDLAAGSKLPSIRKLAAQLGVARNTVDAAYKQLRTEGYIQGKQGSGYTVRASAFDEKQIGASAAQPTDSELLLDPAQEHFTYDFCYGNLGPDIFPIETWRRLSADVLSDKNAAKLASYGGVRGERGLRVQIAEHLARRRGVECRPEQIVITSGTQQSIALVIGLFNGTLDTAAVDDPGYSAAHVVFQNAGIKLEGLRTDAGPLAFADDVENSHAQIIYTTPSHQFPMGWCMSQDIRTRLLAHAVQEDAYILEDDYDSVYRYASQPVPALQSIDRWERVIYLGTFSKIISPAIRMSFVVLPPSLLPAYERSFLDTRPTVSRIEQWTLQRFMETGNFERQIHRAQLAYRKRYQALLDSLDRAFDSRVKVHEDGAGLFLLLTVNNGLDQEDLIAAASRRDVRVYPTHDFWLNSANVPDNLVLLGFSAISEGTIKKGTTLLKHAWFPS